MVKLCVESFSLFFNTHIYDYIWTRHASTLSHDCAHFLFHTVPCATGPADSYMFLTVTSHLSYVITLPFYTASPYAGPPLPSPPPLLSTGIPPSL